ncbi:hypothetical protein SAMN05192565_11121 [Methylobacterium gossipiicola]|uniref:Thiol:disulfide interchange protein DsbG n=1 Tax=Methylobacterium gossipiicola TaxID=582675 RepID=A0A1I2UM80_9HYPH|nr:hypothetical protein SAMN05192565_11121 [Methylobacterium gossipiicola]
MESAVKHIAWAGSLIACVFFATDKHWVPVQIQIVASPTTQNLAALSNGSATANALPATGLASAPPASPALPASPQVAQSPAAPSANFATIEDTKKAGQVIETLGKLAAIVDVPAGTPESRVATIFFDPRCPYCHAAFTALHGQVAARWIPVVVLGDSEAGTRMAAAILSAPDHVAALKSAFDAKLTPAAAPSPEIAAKLDENRQAFASIFAAAPQLRPGVPTLFVPRPDGRLAIMVGYEPGDDAKLRSVLTGS